VIAVLIVDDHSMVREGLRSYLERIEGIDVVAEATDGQAALAVLAGLASRDALPDVVLADLIMPGIDGIALTAQIADSYPAVRVVALTSSSEALNVEDALAAGANGYLLKSSEPEFIVSAIRAAARGQTFIDPEVAAILTRSLRDTSKPLLSAREREVVALVAKGQSNQEIASTLFISERTARTHVSHVISKLGLSSRMQVALWAIRQGISSAD
jgi:DNA-binding NarL/FixJ family response regulator